MDSNNPAKTLTDTVLTRPDINSPNFHEQAMDLADEIDEVIQMMVSKLCDLTGKCREQVESEIEETQIEEKDEKEKDQKETRPTK